MTVGLVAKVVFRLPVGLRRVPQWSCSLQAIVSTSARYLIVLANKTWREWPCLCL